MPILHIGFVIIDDAVRGFKVTHHQKHGLGDGNELIYPVMEKKTTVTPWHC